jgi:hypothetical protein
MSKYNIGDIIMLGEKITPGDNIVEINPNLYNLRIGNKFNIDYINDTDKNNILYNISDKNTNKKYIIPQILLTTYFTKLGKIDLEKHIMKDDYFGGLMTKRRKSRKMKKSRKMRKSRKSIKRKRR